MSSDFVHLHVHSEYSLLDGYATTKGIVERAAELGMDSIALTDHGVMYGALEFYTNAQKVGVKPILGMEAYMAPGSARAPMVKGGKNYYHLLLLAQNDVGYRNLVKLTTRAHLDGLSSRGIFARPRIDREMLEQYHEGIVVTSTCIAGEVIQHLTQRQKDKARETAAWHRDLLGPDNYYIELQLHENTPELEEVNDELVRIADELKIPLVATNDTHFLRAEDLQAHTMVMAMGFNLTQQELCSKNYQMDESYHIMSADDMWQRFKRYGTAPIENTRRIADMCNLKLEFGRVQLPEFELPEGHTNSSYLRLVCEEGLMRHFNGAPPEEYRRRLDYELGVIDQTGFPDYMLIVWDFVKYARARGIPCLPRGSAGGSLVVYCLDITDVDPVANKLVFERFLNPERNEMPDIDMDFADSRRHEVLEYIASKYGRANVAQIITYGTLGAKAALRDIGRVLDVPLGEVDRVAKLVPALPVGTTIAQALQRVPDLKTIYDSNAQLRDVIDWAQKVEGRMKSVGTHACGVVVSRTPLEELVPLQRTTKDDNAVMAAYEGSTLGKIGLLKMDVLGLTNLSIVAEALTFIESTTGKRLDLTDIPLDDTATFESLGRGETTNVFQLESPPMTRHLMALKPTRVEDLCAMVALYRPGPMEQIPVYIHNKNNPRDIRYLHPILKPLLQDTYGVIVYQEQVLSILTQMAGYTTGRADIVRRAIGKKDRQLMAQEEPAFKEGCIRNGLSRDQADRLWELIQPFAGYSFNRAHATLYGLLAYQTAWLKLKYPTEYMAAVLTAAAGDIDDVAKSVAECGRLGVAVLPASANHSSAGFTIERLPDGQHSQHANRQGIRFGLSAVRNVGSGPIAAIIAEREKAGPFKTLEELCDRVDRHALNKRVLESLTKCGAIDDLPGTRLQKLAVLDAVLGAAVEAQRTRELGQASMWELLGGGAEAASFNVPLPELDESPADYKQQLAWEKELLGMYISEHPVAQALRAAPPDPNRLTLSQLGEEHLGQKVTLIGMLTGIRRVLTKKNDTMLIAQLEDLDGTIDLVAFPRVYEKYSAFWEEDRIVAVTAKMDSRNGNSQLVCEEVAEYLDVEAAAPVAVVPAASQFYDDMAYADDDAPPPGDDSWSALDTYPPADGGAYEMSDAMPQIVGNGHTANGNGQVTAHDSDDSQPPQGAANGPAEASPSAAAPPVPLVRTPQRITIMRKDIEQPAGSAAGPQYTLHIHLPRTDDYGADLRCMQQVSKQLRQHRGEHRVMLYLPKDDAVVVMESADRVDAVAQLVGSLRELLSEDAVQVEGL